MKHMAKVLKRVYSVEIDRCNKTVTVINRDGSQRIFKDNQNNIFFDDYGNERYDEDIVTIIEEELGENPI